jgi:predicted  nucleic acid-binding Zn-ribbon protein
MTFQLQNEDELAHSSQLLNQAFSDPQLSQLQAELKNFKDMWGETQCKLQDAEEKYKESEKERSKTLSLLKSTIEELALETAKIEELEKQLTELGSSGMDQDRAKNVS